MKNPQITQITQIKNKQKSGGGQNLVMSVGNLNRRILIKCLSVKSVKSVD
jgi:hypothetical protein